MTVLVLATISGLVALAAACLHADGTALVAFGAFVASALTLIIPWSIDRAKRKALGGQ